MSVLDTVREIFTPPSTPVTSNHLAFAIYTSGSTGEPKGVMLTHRSIVNYVAGILQAVGTECFERSALLFNPSLVRQQYGLFAFVNVLFDYAVDVGIGQPCGLSAPRERGAPQAKT